MFYTVDFFLNDVLKTSVTSASLIVIVYHFLGGKKNMVIFEWDFLNIQILSTKCLITDFK